MNRYLVLTILKPTFQPALIDAHYAFLDKLKANNQLEMAGPFTDKTGGAYIILAENIEKAESLAFSDPLHTTNSSTVTLHEWNAK